MTIGGLRPLARRLVELTALAVPVEDDTPHPGHGTERDRSRTGRGL